ncbi:hypothetical protein C8J32_10646 [Rhizobium sp. PP-CC-3A-592]|nr:hypothetical protein C8J32_10646 [Rhizobium sp. PP-CC-3A-592]
MDKILKPDNNCSPDEEPVTGFIQPDDYKTGSNIIDDQEVSNEILNIYKLLPNAAPVDPRWLGAASAPVVFVAAYTSGDARIVATEAEVDFLDISAKPAEGVSTAFASMFRDEKLYTVIEVEHGRTDLKRGVVSGDLNPAVTKPQQTS